MDLTNLATVQGIGVSYCIDREDMGPGSDPRFHLVIPVNCGPRGVDAIGSVPCRMKNCLGHEFKTATEALVVAWNMVIEDLEDNDVLFGESRIGAVAATV